VPEFLTKLKGQFTDFWGNLDKSQKKRIYITSAIVAARRTGRYGSCDSYRRQGLLSACE
jgi:hypothetical protein